MANYYFHLRDGDDVLIDPDGRELPSIATVAAATLFEAREIISHDARSGLVRLTHHIDVEDSSGALVHHLDFEDAISLVRSPGRG